MKSSLVFSFNIQRRYFEQFGLKHFQNVQSSLKDQQLYLFPIINEGSSTIEQRAKYIQIFLPQFLYNQKIEKADILAYSLSGIDYRLYINQFNGEQNIKSLTTICTPNKGSFLLSEYNKRNIELQYIEPLAKILGVELKSLTEFNQENIQDFNNFVTNSDQIKYFSIGGEKLQSHSSEIFKETNKYIFEKKEKGWMSDNDGIFAEDEIKWGEHLLNFELDHAEFLGLGSKNQCQQVYKFAADNIQHSFN